MKSRHIIFYSILATVFYLYSQNKSYIYSSASSASSSSSSLIFLPGRRPMRELSMSSSNQKSQYHKIKVADEETKRSEIQVGFMALKHGRSGDNLDELVYHIDYHGVSTHPTPTPKHPKP